MAPFTGFDDEAGPYIPLSWYQPPPPCSPQDISYSPDYGTYPNFQIPLDLHENAPPTRVPGTIPPPPEWLSLFGKGNKF